MKLAEVISMVDDIKPNAFSNASKTVWINEVEGLVQTEVWLRAIDEIVTYNYTTDSQAELLVVPPHHKIYWAYLAAMIDFANGEYDKYQNSMAVFNQYYSEYMRWFAERYRPADALDDLWPGYYISAYGLAVKHGYVGTEEEWLASLQGEDGPATEMRYENEMVQWKSVAADEWEDLFDMADLRGEVIEATLSEAEGYAEAAAGSAAEAAQSASAIVNMTASAEALEAGETPTVTKTGGGGTPYNLHFGIPAGEPGADGSDGAPGAPGQDGFSPTVTVEAITGGHLVSITDAEGTNDFSVMDGVNGQDGRDGQDGAPGQDGFSPYVTVEAIAGGHLVSITDAEGINDFSVMDGIDGQNGQDGQDGGDGVGITTIVYDHQDSSGGNVYKVNLTDGSYYYITAPKGDPGSGGGGEGDMRKADYDSDSAVRTAGGIAAYVEDAIDPIEELIPGQASSSNQLADKAFVNSTVGTNTANYISNSGQPFTSVAQLQAYGGTVTNNDYAFVTGTDSAGNTYYDRYKATVSGTTVSWAKEYRLNNSSFTAVQWAAIESGITADKVSAYDGYQSAISAKYAKPSSGIPKTDLASDVQTSLGLADTALQDSDTEEADELTIDTVVTENSGNLITSGAVEAAISAAIANVEASLDALDALIGG